MQQILTNSDKLTKKYIINRISDINGGISLTLADLRQANVVLEGSPLSAPASGMRTVCKQAKLLTGSTTTVFRVETETHHFKVGDNLMQSVGATAYPITDVAIAAGTVGDVTYDTLTIGTALEAATAGIFIYQSSATGATAAVLSNDADTILKEAFVVPTSGTTVIYMAGAFIRADVVADSIGPLYLSQLIGVIEHKR